MIDIIFYTKNNKKYSFECSGHAGYSDYGNDIVCSAVSALVINCINSINELTDSKTKLDSDDENGGYLKFEVESALSSDVSILIESLYLGLNEIKKNYNNYIDLHIEEV